MSMLGSPPLRDNDVCGTFLLRRATGCQIALAVTVDPNNSKTKATNEVIPALLLNRLCDIEACAQLPPCGFNRIQILRTLWIVLQERDVLIVQRRTGLLRPQALLMVLHKKGGLLRPEAAKALLQPCGDLMLNEPLPSIHYRIIGEDVKNTPATKRPQIRFGLASPAPSNRQTDRRILRRERRCNLLGTTWMDQGPHESKTQAPFASVLSRRPSHLCRPSAPKCLQFGPKPMLHNPCQRPCMLVDEGFASSTRQVRFRQGGAKWCEH